MANVTDGSQRIRPLKVTLEPVKGKTQHSDAAFNGKPDEINLSMQIDESGKPYLKIRVLHCGDGFSAKSVHAYIPCVKTLAATLANIANKYAPPVKAS